MVVWGPAWRCLLMSVVVVAALAPTAAGSCHNPINTCKLFPYTADSQDPDAPTGPWSTRVGNMSFDFSVYVGARQEREAGADYQQPGVAPGQDAVVHVHARAVGAPEAAYQLLLGPGAYGIEWSGNMRWSFETTDPPERWHADFPFHVAARVNMDHAHLPLELYAYDQLGDDFAESAFTADDYRIAISTSSGSEGKGSGSTSNPVPAAALLMVVTVLAGLAWASRRR